MSSPSPPRLRVGRRALLRILASLGLLGAVGALGRSGGQDGWLARLLPGNVWPEGAGALQQPRLVVSIVRDKDPEAAVRKAIELAGGLEGIIRRGSAVVIKPNLTIPSPSGQGNVTDPRVLQAVIEASIAAGAASVAVGDGAGGGNTEEIMRQAGYERVLKETGAHFVDLNQDDSVALALSGGLTAKEYHIARTVAEAPVFISVPVLKTHNEAIVSLSCKNLMGIPSTAVYGQPRWSLHHLSVQRVIADLVSVRPPDFAIVDGTVGLEGDSPMNGTPVPMDLVVAGANPVSVDAVAAAIMGFAAADVEHLALLARQGRGEIDLRWIEVKGSSVREVRRPFRPG